MSVVRKLSLPLVIGSLLLGVVGCGDSSGPDSGVRVDVSVQRVLGPTVYPDSVGNPTVFCTVDVQASARGAGSALWLDATLRWYQGADRSTAVDSSIMPFDEIRGSWGQAEIAPGETLDTRWEFTAYAPFAASIQYRYRQADGGPTRSSTVRFDCSPPIPANPQPPTISSLTVTAPAGDLEPGDTLTISYVASSPSKLWRSYVQLSGPCAVEVPVTENLESSVTRTLRIPIGAQCRLGVPFTVWLITYDAALQSATREARTSLSLVDVTPPWIAPQFFLPNGGTSFTPSGDYFAGDSIRVNFIAGDNAGLSALIWEVLPYGIRDSVIVTPPSSGRTVFIRLRPEWSGPIELRLYARDQQKLVSNIVMSAPNALRVFPTVPRATAQATVPGEIRDLAIDARRGVIYLLQSNQNRIAMLQMSTMQVSSTLAMPSYPRGLDLSAGGDSLIVTLAQGALGIIDLRLSPLAVAIVPLSDLDQSLQQRPLQVRVASNGKALVSLDGTSALAARLYEVDLRSGAQRRRTDAANGGTVDGKYERSLDRSKMSFINGSPRCFQTYDAASDAFGSCASADIFLTGWAPTLDATGQRSAINHDVYDASLRLIRRVVSPITSGVVPTALSPDGQFLYVAVPRLGIVRSRVSDGTMVDRSFVSFASSAILRLSADGEVLVVVQADYGPTTMISTMDMR